MNPVIKILARTDGSITTIIEALTGEEVRIRTLKKEVIKADEEIAERLQISSGDEVNLRVVEILSRGEIFAIATSLIPLRRVPEELREDLLGADEPIGKLIRKHRLEVRREILHSEIREVEGIGKALVRNYNIIFRGEILMHITEIFPVAVFDKLIEEILQSSF